MPADEEVILSMKSIMQFLHFGYHQAMSCLFPVAIFGTLALSSLVDWPIIHRYDAILLILVAVQYLMYRGGLETIDEVKVIGLFHIIGLMLEMYKVHMGSWSYPEPGLTKLLGVPLYSGFMYASVASFMCQIWRRLGMDMTGWPGLIPAENITTFFNAWKYPDQHAAWKLVSFSKISSWFLLVIISVIIVAQLKHVKTGRSQPP